MKMTEEEDLIIDLGRHKVSFKWTEANKIYVFRDAEGYYLDYATQCVSKRYDRLHEDERPIGGIKRCRTCKRIKSFTDFTQDLTAKSGKIMYCRPCATSKHRDYLRANPGFKGKSEKARATYRLRKHKHRKSPLNRLRHQIKRIIKGHLNELRDKNLYIKALSCRSHDFIQHLESMFDGRMNWSNRSIDGWHIDHIIPVSAFDIGNPLHVKWAWHYLNTQPLWGKDNEDKGDKLPSGESARTLRDADPLRFHQTIGSELERLGIVSKAEYINSLNLKSEEDGEFFSNQSAKS